MFHKDKSRNNGYFWGPEWGKTVIFFSKLRFSIVHIHITECLPLHLSKGKLPRSKIYFEARNENVIFFFFSHLCIASCVKLTWNQHGLLFVILCFSCEEAVVIGLAFLLTKESKSFFITFEIQCWLVFIFFSLNFYKF
jgi:hypothetical protein